jgi:ribosomal protein L29
MAIIRKAEIKKMSKADRENKIKELEKEIVKNRVGVSKGAKINIREMKKTIARLFTFNRLNTKSVRK